jgi:hypothetical protein
MEGRVQITPWRDLTELLANMEWCGLFDVVGVSILARICSDHISVYVAYSTSSAIKWNKRRQFRFEANWLVQSEPRKIIRQAWRVKPPVPNKWCDVGKRLVGCRKTLQQWRNRLSPNPWLFLLYSLVKGMLEMKKKLL